MLPGRPIEFTTAVLEDFLPDQVIWTLQREVSDPRWGVKLKDESSLRYIFMSVLEWHGVQCPHPWRNTFPGYSDKSFECRMCRITFFHNEDIRHR